ncbi:MAG TPA: nicotinic acid mononucleotide adenylyltransferase [Planctomycetaceae bacterium]|nr:nicotinic acid mononucleotide adenylyltransferase [Planctomycetaceae bacterium]
MRLGIFGGTFDPVHVGHLLLAETCREQCELDAIWFVPAAFPPHKLTRKIASDKDRIEMLQLATAGHPSFQISTVEIDRGGVSYTAETLTHIQQQHPEAELFFLMGADSLAELATWKDPQRICELAIPLVVRRAGSPTPDLAVFNTLASPTRLTEISRYQVEMPVLEISSTDLRERAGHQRSLRYQVPRAVECYIETQRLYRD